MACQPLSPEQSRTVNLLGALAVALTDQIRQTGEQLSGQGAAGPAAIVQVGTAPDQSIDYLRLVLGLSHSGTVRLVDRLASEGLMRRHPGSDGRVALLTLTDDGHALRDRLLAGRREVLAHALADLSPDDWQSLTRLIEKIMPRLTESIMAAEHICRLCEIDACPQERCPVEPLDQHQTATSGKQDK